MGSNLRLKLSGTFRGNDRQTGEWGILRTVAGLDRSSDLIGTRFGIAMLAGPNAAVKDLRRGLSISGALSHHARRKETSQ